MDRALKNYENEEKKFLKLHKSTENCTFCVKLHTKKTRVRQRGLGCGLGCTLVVSVMHSVAAVGSVAQWLGRRLTLTRTLSMVDRLLVDCPLWASQLG